MWDKPEELHIVDDEAVFMGKAHFFDNLSSLAETNLEGLTVTGTGSVQQVFEKAVVIDNPPLSSEVNVDIKNGSLIYYSSNASDTWTWNLRGDASTPLNSLLPIGKSITLTMLCAMGTTAQLLNAPADGGIKIDNTAQNVKWINGSAPSAGFASAINGYTFVIIKTAENTYTILASLTQFA